VNFKAQDLQHWKRLKFQAQEKHQKNDQITLLAMFVSFKAQEEQQLKKLKFQAQKKTKRVIR